MRRELTIDAEFRDKVPPLTEAEFAQLEANIVEEGRILVPLVIWNGVIVDGHNRYAIARKHPEIEYEVVEKDFTDRYEAIVWICRNQLGRRNLSEEQKSYLVAQQYEAERKTTVGAPTGNQNAKQCGQNGPIVSDVPKRTVTRIAKEHGIGETTVKRDVRFAKGVDAAEEAAPGAKAAILSGKSGATKADVAAIAKMDPEERKRTAEAIRDGTYTRPKKDKPVKPKSEPKPEPDVPQETTQDEDDDTEEGDDDVEPDDDDDSDEEEEDTDDEEEDGEDDVDGEDYEKDYETRHGLKHVMTMEEIYADGRDGRVANTSVEDLLGEVNLAAKNFVDIVKCTIAYHPEIMSTEGAYEKMANALSGAILKIENLRRSIIS